MNNTKEVVIIGGGPAGLATALYTARANLNPLVLAGSPPGGQLMLTTEVENYPGFESILGPNLIDTYRKHVTKFGARILDENVQKVDFSSTPYKIYLTESAAKKLNLPLEKDKDGHVALQTKAVVIATGAKALWLGLENETRLRGKGVSACATCDGFFFREKNVGVVGGGDTAMEEALTLTRFAKKVYLIHRRDSFRASKVMQDRVLAHEKIEVIWNTTVTDVLGEIRVEGLRLKTNNGEEKDLPTDALFLAIGHKPDTEVFKDHIDLDQKGYVVTSATAALNSAKSGEKLGSSFDFNFQTMTSVPGVFSAGDCVDHQYRQAATAVGMGVGAALDAERWLEVTTA